MFSLADLKALSLQLPEKIPYLKMLVLFGSRARGDSHPNSDWDFAALYDPEKRECLTQGSFSWFEVPVILSAILGLPDDQIDVVELNQCSPLIAHFVARDGSPLYEQEPGEFENFRQKSLLSDFTLKQLRQAQREDIHNFLRAWSV